jgi:hypothetical protein
MDTQDAAKRSAINDLKISPAELCRCNIEETVFSLEGTTPGATFASYIERTSQAADGAFVSDDERRSLNAFFEAYQRANENCVSRMVPPSS